MANTGPLMSCAYWNTGPGVTFWLKYRYFPSGEKAGSPSSFWNSSLGRFTSCTPSPPSRLYSQISPVPSERRVVKCLRPAT